MEHIGGQAVIEGVMMRSGRVWTVAVRSPDNTIVVKKHQLAEIPGLLQKPVIRGVIALYQALSIGIKALLFSAEASGQETEKPSPFSLVLTVVVAFIIGIGLFIFFPLYSTRLLGTLFQSINESSFLFNIVDGLIRVLVFVFYILAINMSREIQRVFQYHGAEHMAVNAHEAGEELRPDIVRNYSVLHTRCGTSFLLIVMMLSIFVFSLIPKDWLFWEKFISRIVLIPFIAGASYEFVRFSSRQVHNPIVHMVAKPGLWLQRLTTGVPTKDMIEVAIKALSEVLNKNCEKNGGEGE